MTKICHISDTHTLHQDVVVPDADILVHSGDCLNSGAIDELPGFLKWFSSQPHKHKIMIAGNHDRCFETMGPDARKMVEEAGGIIYLQDSGCEIDGIKFWGSPFQPEFCDWAFNLPRGRHLKRHWDMIPNDTDVLITHGPALGLRDKPGGSRFDDRCGCKDLYEALLRIEPKAHLFGHIHHSYGSIKLISDQGRVTQCFNSAICNERYLPINKPQVFEI